jgi:hypothetical protein
MSGTNVPGHAGQTVPGQRDKTTPPYKGGCPQSLSPAMSSRFIRVSGRTPVVKATSSESAVQIYSGSSTATLFRQHPPTACMDTVSLLVANQYRTHFPTKLSPAEARALETKPKRAQSAPCLAKAVIGQNDTSYKSRQFNSLQVNITSIIRRKRTANRSKH